MRFPLLSRSLPALLVATTMALALPVAARDDQRRGHDRDHREHRDDYREFRREHRDERREHRDERRESRREHRDDDREFRREHRDAYREFHREHRDERRWDRYDHHRDNRRDRARVVYREVYRAPAWGYGPGWSYGPPPRHSRHHGPPRWSRGWRIHDYGWAPTYVVIDYPRYGLYHPPRGHHWRRDDRGDWLLVVIATGIIADVVFN